MGKSIVSMNVTDSTKQLLEKLGRKLVPGVELSRGDVVDYLVAEKAQTLGIGRGSLLDALGEVPVIMAVEEKNDE